ncbi:MAG: hypothetical protein ACOY3P_14395 [Planctomycetota bacterium]
MGSSGMEYVALILFCGLLADSLLTKQKPRVLTERLKDLEDAIRDKSIAEQVSGGNGGRRL